MHTERDGGQSSSCPGRRGEERRWHRREQASGRWKAFGCSRAGSVEGVMQMVARARGRGDGTGESKLMWVP